MVELDLHLQLARHSPRTAADLANRMDEKPGRCNRNLPGVEYACELVGESAGGLNSRPDIPYRWRNIGTHIARKLMEEELLLLGVSTCVANGLTGCSADKASIKSGMADLLAYGCSEAADA